MKQNDHVEMMELLRRATEVAEDTWLLHPHGRNLAVELFRIVAELRRLQLRQPVESN